MSKHTTHCLGLLIMFQLCALSPNEALIPARDTGIFFIADQYVECTQHMWIAADSAHVALLSGILCGVSRTVSVQHLYGKFIYMLPGYVLVGVRVHVF